MHRQHTDRLELKDLKTPNPVSENIISVYGRARAPRLIPFADIFRFFCWNSMMRLSEISLLISTAACLAEDNRVPDIERYVGPRST